MLDRLKLCALFMALLLMSGCAARKESASDTTAFHRSYQTAFDKEPTAESRNILKKARSAIGTPYVRGGKDTEGFDCSGFVCWAYKSAGIDLPRTAREQSQIGTPITRIEDMREGDIVAFRHPRRGYHTGIYVGDGKFIHSPRRRSSVRITSLSDPYFNNTLIGARRVSFSENENLVAQARARLNDYAEQKAVRDLSERKNSKSAKIQNKNDRTGKTKLVAADKKTDTSKSAKSKNAKTNLKNPSKDSKNKVVSDGSSTKSKAKNSQDKANKKT